MVRWQLELTIGHWEAYLTGSGWLLSPDQRYLVEQTIKYLKELKEIKLKEGKDEALNSG